MLKKFMSSERTYIFVERLQYEFLQLFQRPVDSLSPLLLHNWFVGLKLVKGTKFILSVVCVCNIKKNL